MQTGNAVIISEIKSPVRLVHSRPVAEPDQWSDRHFNDVSAVCSFVGTEIRLSKMKYSKIAEMANCAPSTVSNLAHGETNFPRFGTVLQILRALGFEVVVRG
jgi:hypothetical protein